MQTNRGVFLTEIIVFLFLFSFFSLLVMQFIATSTTSLAKINKKSDQIATLTSAIDWLMRDIQNIDIFVSQIILENKMLKVFSALERITWKLYDAKLLRVSQRYDTKIKHWKKPYTCLVAKNVTCVTFSLLYNKKISENQNIIGIRCKLSGLITEQTKHIDQTIALRNRVL